VSVVFQLEAPYRGTLALHRITMGGGPGPVVALVAGVHGNEVVGTHALNLVANMLRVQRPRGTVHLLPLVNTVGAEEARKRWPFDDRDINGAFPGDPDGQPVERIAAAVMEATHADVCVDVQSGSSFVHEHPHARAPLSGRALELARAMQLPVTWRRAALALDDGLAGAWAAEGRVALQVRGGRGGTLDLGDATLIARGLVRLLAAAGILGGGHPGAPTLETTAVHDVRVSGGGFFVPEVAPGDRVAAGTLLGLLRAPIGGALLDEVRAPTTGTVLALRTWPMVHARELVVRIAEAPA
jgi:predicted deacylase